MKKPRVVVLLSTYNGEKYLPQLLDSVEHQKDVRLDILVRDDGSIDGTMDILNRYNEEYKNITIIKGKNCGYAKSFWELIKNAGEYDYYALCDQDDVWYPEKISAAIKKITNDEPMLYTSSVDSINDNYDIIEKNTFRTNGVLNVYESFQKSCIPGCVFVFNDKAQKIIIRYNGFMESHDWAIYCIVNTFGKIVYDERSWIKYRIHSGNTIGAISLFEKIKRFFSPKKCTRSKFARDFYDTYADEIPNKYKNEIYMLGHYRDSIKERFNLFFSKKFKGFWFKIYILMGRI